MWGSTGEPTPDSRPPAEIRAGRILWLAFVASVFVFVLVIVLIRGVGRSATPASESLPILRPILYGAGLVEFLLSFRLRRLASGGSSWSGRPRAEGGTGFPPDAAMAVRPASAGERAPLPLSGQVIGWAMLDSVAILGLVLALLGGGLVDAFPLLLLSLFGFMLQRPE